MSKIFLLPVGLEQPNHQTRRNEKNIDVLHHPGGQGDDGGVDFFASSLRLPLSASRIL